MTKLTKIEVADRFLSLFDGYTGAHGVTTVTGKISEKGKAEVRCKTVRGAISYEEIDAHFMGSGIGIGVVPLRDDHTTLKFAVIDIDDYNMSPEEMSRRIWDLKLPLIPCRSKSGGLHCVLFCKTAIPAALVIKKLEEWATVLGYDQCEVFPKQTTRADKRDEMGNIIDVGNWINLPYYKIGKDSDRYALKNGVPISILEFFTWAEQIAVTEEQLLAMDAAGLDNDHKWFPGGYPCLQAIADEGGCGEGGRNEFMYMVATCIKRIMPDSWQTKMHVINDEMCTPALPHSEIEALNKQFLKGKNLQPKCNAEPMKSHCNKALCRKAKFGTGPGVENTDQVLRNLTKLEGGEEPLWFLEVGGKRLAFSTDDLLLQPKFGKRVLEGLNKTWSNMQPRRWQEVLQDLLDKVEVVQVPFEISLEGQFDSLLQKYLAGVAQNKERFELVTGSPWYDGEGQVWFLYNNGLKDFLKGHGFKVENDALLWNWIREKGGDNKQLWIRLKTGKRQAVFAWHLPYTPQEEEETGEIPEFGSEAF